MKNSKLATNYRTLKILILTTTILLALQNIAINILNLPDLSKNPKALLYGNAAFMAIAFTMGYEQGKNDQNEKH